MRLIWCVFVFTLFGAANFATVAVAEDSAVEYITVSGVVKDSMGELVNAHVYLKSNNRVGDVTDNDGWFELQVPKGDTLVVSYLGYESQNLTELHEDMDIELKQSAETLDAVEVVWERACSISDVPNSVEREKDEESGKCVAISCVDGYEVQNGKCVEETVDQVVGEETELDDDEKDTQEPRAQQGEPQKEPSPVAETDTESVKEAQEKKVAELQENYDNMKEIENSFENRMLGATGMATMGIGGMQLATAMTEDRADEAAEQQMKAYLATFSCTYADGKRFSGGETAIELPGGNELINLYSEYVGLANDLKTRKEALGLRAGIESQSILDSATSGLYDDISTGKTSGAFTSLARALSDPNGADAAAWAAQREETAKQKKTALATIGIGAVATVAGNLLINRNNEKERSAEILEKYEEATKGIDAILKQAKFERIANRMEKIEEKLDGTKLGNLIERIFDND